MRHATLFLLPLPSTSSGFCTADTLHVQVRGWDDSASEASLQRMRQPSRQLPRHGQLELQVLHPCCGLVLQGMDGHHTTCGLGHMVGGMELTLS